MTVAARAQVRCSNRQSRSQELLSTVIPGYREGMEAIKNDSPSCFVYNDRLSQSSRPVLGITDRVSQH